MKKKFNDYLHEISKPIEDSPNYQLAFSSIRKIGEAIEVGMKNPSVAVEVEIGPLTGYPMKQQIIMVVKSSNFPEFEENLYRFYMDIDKGFPVEVDILSEEDLITCENEAEVAKVIYEDLKNKKTIFRLRSIL